MFGLPVCVAVALVMSVAAGMAGADEGPDLSDKRVAILVGEGFHDGETFFPMAHLVNHGASVSVVGLEPGIVEAYNSDMTARVTHEVSVVSIDDFDALVIPGGRSPAWLREHDEVVMFVREFVESGKPVAAICHGPQVLVRAGVVEGRTLTAIGGVEGELTEAGATFVDVPLQQDGNLITSRVPGDLPGFVAAISGAIAP